MTELAADDAPFLAALAAVTDDRWRELWAALDALDGETTFAEWAGGEVVGTTEGDGHERPVVQVPYPLYTDAVERLRDAIGASGLIVPYDWMAWDGLDRYRDPADLARAPAADAVRLVVAIVRSERFGDGNILAALQRDLLQAALARLRAEHP